MKMSVHLQRAIGSLMKQLIGLSAKVEESVKRAVQSLDEEDAELARKVIKDDEVDRMHHQLSAEVLEAIKKNSDKAGTLIQYIHIIRHLERIADHITNIAEDIIYLIKGEIIRHNTGLEEG